MIRDDQIAREAGEGIPRRELAAKYGITEARISQIVLAKHEEITDDANRAILFAELDFVKSKILEIFSRPRPPKVTPSGLIVFEPLIDENGEPVRAANGKGFLSDYSKPVYDDAPYIEAAKMVPNLSKEQASLYGLHRPKAKEKDESAELQNLLAWAQGNVDKVKEQQALIESLQQQLGAEPEIFEAEVITPRPGEGDQEGEDPQPGARS